MKNIFEDSILKWKWIVKNWNHDIDYEQNHFYLFKEHPHLSKYKHGCPLCDKFKNCKKCPLLFFSSECFKGSSYYKKWYNDTGLEKDKKALKMLDSIKYLYNEYKKEL